MIYDIVIRKKRCADVINIIYNNISDTISPTSKNKNELKTFITFHSMSANKVGCSVYWMINMRIKILKKTYEILGNCSKLCECNVDNNGMNDKCYT